MSRAPYNFVPLNETVVPGQPPPSGDHYHPDRLSGSIELTITTKTPLFIRGEGSDFFRGADGRPAIPGSSLRGLVRTLVEIVSRGKFATFDDRRFHYRAVGDSQSSIGHQYQRQMIKRWRHNGDYAFAPLARAGVLEKNGSGYTVRPSPGIFRVDQSVLTAAVLHPPRPPFRRVYFQKEPVSLHRHVLPKGQPLWLEYALVVDIGPARTSARTTEGLLVFSGPFGTRKHMQWIIELPTQGPPLDVPPAVIEKYRGDTQRDSGYDLLEWLEKPPAPVPCFYIIDAGGTISAIGHTGFFRLPYQKTVKDHVPDAVRNPRDAADQPVTDMAEAIFGREAGWATRVFFEDALPPRDEKLEHFLLEETALQVLGAPKPTAFPHYLEQPGGHRAPVGNLNHWDSDARLRGYKLYWHRNVDPTQWKGKVEFSARKLGEYLQEKRHPAADNLKNLLEEGIKQQILSKDQNNPDRYACQVYFECLPKPLKSVLRDFTLGSTECQHTIATPARQGKTFRGRVRFENLTGEELGALLFVLDLPGGCCHKLGLGKPLGLGSVQIKIGLAVIDHKSRDQNYQSLFNEQGGWRTGASACDQNRVDSYKKDFSRYVLNNSAAEPGDLWNDPRMKQLKAMLDWNRTRKRNWLEKTGYLPLDEFRNREPLPAPENV